MHKAQHVTTSTAPNIAPTLIAAMSPCDRPGPGLDVCDVDGVTLLEGVGVYDVLGVALGGVGDTDTVSDGEGDADRDTDFVRERLRAGLFATLGDVWSRRGRGGGGDAAGARSSPRSWVMDTTVGGTAEWTSTMISSSKSCADSRGQYRMPSTGG